MSESLLIAASFFTRVARRLAINIIATAAKATRASPPTTPPAIAPLGTGRLGSIGFALEATGGAVDVVDVEDEVGSGGEIAQEDEPTATKF